MQLNQCWSTQKDNFSAVAISLEILLVVNDDDDEDGDGNDDNNTNVCKVHDVSNYTDSEALAVAQWVALVMDVKRWDFRRCLQSISSLVGENPRF